MSDLLTIGHCRDCHWFPRSITGDYKLCVWHNGSRGTVKEQIRAGAKNTVPIYVHESFGCVCFEWREEKE